MKTQSILRLVGNPTLSPVPVIPANSRIGLRPTVEEINTTGIDLSDWLTPGSESISVPRPGYYTFSGSLCAETDYLGIYIIDLFSGKDHTNIVQGISETGRLFAHLSEVTLKLKAGHRVALEGFNGANQDAPVWLGREAFWFQVRYEGE